MGQALLVNVMVNLISVNLREIKIVEFTYGLSLLHSVPYEPRREKTGFLHMRKKNADQLRGTAKLISSFVFAR